MRSKANSKPTYPQVLVQFEITPKAFANRSPVFERSENPGDLTLYAELKP